MRYYAVIRRKRSSTSIARHFRYQPGSRSLAWQICIFPAAAESRSPPLLLSLEYRIVHAFVMQTNSSV